MIGVERRTDFINGGRVVVADRPTTRASLFKRRPIPAVETVVYGTVDGDPSLRVEIGEPVLRWRGPGRIFSDGKVRSIRTLVADEVRDLAREKRILDRIERNEANWVNRFDRALDKALDRAEKAAESYVRVANWFLPKRRRMPIPA